MNRLINSQALGVLLILGGALLLIAQFFGGTAALLWPFFIIVPGLVLAVMAERSDWHSSITVAAAIVTATGLILMVQNIYDYFQSWAYAWTLLPLAAGAALYYSGDRRHDEALKTRGKRVMEWSAAAFIIFGAAFELLLFNGGHSWGRILLPLALIVVGGLMLLRRGAGPMSPEHRSEGAKPAEDEHNSGSSA